MARLTNVRERVEHVLVIESEDPALVLPDDQSMVITEIVVPPVTHGEKETLSVVVGDVVATTLPLQFLTDIYRSALSDGTPQGPPEIKEGLSYVLKRTVVAWEEVHGTANFDKAVDLTKLLITALDAHMHADPLGLKLMRSILVAPRQGIEVRTSEQSAVTVWCRGLLSRDVE